MCLMLHVNIQCTSIFDGDIMSYRKLGVNDQLLADVIWHGRTGVFACDSNGFILGANGHFCRLLRFGDVELIGRHFGELLLGRDMSVVVSEFEKLINNDKDVFDLDVAFVSKLGTPIGVHLYVKRGENDGIIFGIGQVIEALSQEQAEAMGVLTRSLMEEWLAHKGLVVSKKSIRWWESATFWGAVAALWPVILGIVWGLDMFFKWYHKGP